MENNFKDLWPKQDDLKGDFEYQKTPYIVLSELADSLSYTYEGKIVGIVTATFREDSKTGQRTNFSYSLYLTGKKTDAQIKLLSIDVEDDGWYPVQVRAYYEGYENDLGVGSNESNLVKVLTRIIQHDNTKALLRDLLKQ